MRAQDMGDGLTALGGLAVHPGRYDVLNGAPEGPSAGGDGLRILHAADSRGRRSRCVSYDRTTTQYPLGTVRREVEAMAWGTASTADG
jgi:hypothetical protein